MWCPAASARVRVEDEHVERPHPEDDAAHGEEPYRARDAEPLVFGEVPRDVGAEVDLHVDAREELGSQPEAERAERGPCQRETKEAVAEKCAEDQGGGQDVEQDSPDARKTVDWQNAPLRSPDILAAQHAPPYGQLVSTLRPFQSLRLSARIGPSGPRLSARHLSASPQAACQ